MRTVEPKASASLPALIAAPLLLAVAALAACGPNQTVVEPAAYEPPAPTVPSCQPNLDGRIDASELQAAVGIPVSFLVSPAGSTHPVALGGSVDAEGHRVWDWSAAAADDRVARITAATLDGRWFAASFPKGQFIAPIDAGSTLWGVYSHDSEALWLQGIASEAQSPASSRTLLVYKAPVALYRFPIQPGSKWVSAGEVRDGTLLGLPYAGRDTYEVQVDGSGRLELPDVSFTQVLRVRTRVTVEPAVGASVSRRQVSFLFECFGEVARATSRDGEPSDDFTVAAEIRRFGL